MKLVRIALLSGLHACAAHAADAPPPADSTGDIKVLLGQWKFLNSSTDFCLERIPAMRDDLRSARTHAEAEIRKAETIVLRETADNREGYRRYIDRYVEMWSRHAGELADSMKRQDAASACTALLSNWQSIDADYILEDWRSFIDRDLPLDFASKPRSDS